MLPPFLVDTYHRYKEDTNDVATWLATTAKRLGFSGNLLDSSSISKQTPKTQRLKGKARIEAKRAEIAQGISTNGPRPGLAQSSGSRPTYTIGINNFITLAKYIAPKVQLVVPESVWSSLDRSIRLREEHSAFHLQQAGKKPSSSDSRHSHFLGVLQKVRDILKPHSKASVLAFDAKVPSNNNDVESRLRNMFEGLIVEEPSEAFLNAPNVSLSTKTDVRYVVENIDDPLELYLGISALLQDCSRIRTALRHIWTSYKESATSLEAAALASNTAILLVQRMEAQFLQDFPLQFTTAKARETFFFVQCALQAEDPMYRVRRGDPTNLRPYELLEASLVVSRFLIESFADILDGISLPLYKAGFFGVYDPARNRSTMSGVEKFDEDKVILLEVMSDIVTFDYANRQYGVTGVDEFSKAVGELRHNKKHTLVLDFAAQIHLDVQHILRGESSKAWEELQSHSKTVLASFEEHSIFHKGLAVDTWPAQNDHVLRILYTRVQRLTHVDSLQETKSQLLIEAGGQPDLSAPDFAFFRTHPWLCGSLLFGIKLDLQAASVNFINAWGSVKFSAHLHNAVRVENPSVQPWADMEMALSFFSPAAIFIGDAPQTLDDCFKRFCLGIGYSAQNFASGGRRSGRGPITSTQGPRGLIEEEKMSPVAYQLRPGYCNSDSSGRSEPDLEKVFQTCLEKSGDRDMMPESKSKAKRKNHTPHEMLVMLANALTHEELPLTFDLFLLHRSAWKLLRKVKEATADDLRRIYGPEYIEKESQLPFVVGYIIMTAIQTKKLGKVLLPKKEDIVSSKLLMLAGTQIDTSMDAGEGSVGLKKLRDEYSLEVMT